jgi:uncharacterized membrane protein
MELPSPLPLTSALRGVVVGGYASTDGKTHGYTWTRGCFKTIDVPGAVFTVASGINGEGEIVGKYVTIDGRSHGFLLERHEEEQGGENRVLR